MNPYEIVEKFGIPIAVACAFAWYIIQQKKSLDEQNQYIQGELSENLESAFKRLEMIIIKLIDQQKKMQIELRGIKSKYEALVEIVNKLIIREEKK